MDIHRPIPFRRPPVRTAIALCLVLAAAAGSALAQTRFSVRDNYTKHEYSIPMRDGVKLFTAVYVPKETSESYPIMLYRTPYSVRPYGEDAYRGSLGPSNKFAEDGFIFAYQDVRGKYMSEGEFENMRPHRPVKSGPQDIDESTDTYDTIEWLINNIPDNNGRVGMWGISYPGFYAAAGIPDSHPALKAVSPQAPIADWYIGDDFHHNGAFFLIDAFRFMSSFGRPRPEPTTRGAPRFQFGMPDAYKFFLELGPLRNANEKYFKDDVAFWNDMMEHGNYDAFWQARNIIPHLKNVRAAVMTVGGLFDAEDLYGPRRIYESVEKQNPGAYNILVLGPWPHGGWGRSDGDMFGDIDFGSKTSLYYRDNIQVPFFYHFLKGEGTLDLAEAIVFRTGANEWMSFDEWPPPDLQERSLYFHADGRLSFELPAGASPDAHDEYLSDPAKPVPYVAETRISRSREYMIEDQRFAARRPDVLVYQTDPLTEDVTLAGPVIPNLFISTTGTDADFVVKLIDVFPDDTPDPSPNPNGVRMGGYQMMVRAEVMRAKFRNSFERPEPLIPNRVTPVSFELRDVCHTFKKGHRIMVQVQSSWFPLVDRNPQTFVDIYSCTEEDFRKATHRVYCSARYPSHLKVGLLKR
ncbi:MAG: CocE/NonD family hydrolase [Armatimonadetes bacterium]|nr:CocE/NonD family hydrolase [Armatimonadota bacterium]